MLIYEYFLILPADCLPNHHSMNRLTERLKNISVIRKMVYATVGFFSYPGLALVNRIQISGTEHLQSLPGRMFYSSAITRPILQM